MDSNLINTFLDKTRQPCESNFLSKHTDVDESILQPSRSGGWHERAGLQDLWDFLDWPQKHTE